MTFCVIFVTVPDADVGERIARTLVAERLAACANRLPGVRSTYTWQGKIENADEELLLIKSRCEDFARVEARVRELHPYEVPEIIATSILAGSPPYLAWMQDSTERTK
mgnify:CR=1 FL=1